MNTNTAILDESVCPIDSWNHWTFLLVTTNLVREHGPATALQRLRSMASLRGVPPSAGRNDRPHETLLVFFVWAVDRLLDAGLSTTQVVWHPLVDVVSPNAWYHPATLDSALARQTFVGSDRAVPGEPAPHLPRR